MGPDQVEEASPEFLPGVQIVSPKPDQFCIDVLSKAQRHRKSGLAIRTVVV
jgi:hypothetical protein